MSDAVSVDEDAGRALPGKASSRFMNPHRSPTWIALTDRALRFAWHGVDHDIFVARP